MQNEDTGDTGDTGDTVTMKVLKLEKQKLTKNPNEESAGYDHDNAAPDDDGIQSEAEE